jgi:putative cell wall-binding protein
MSTTQQQGDASKTRRRRAARSLLVVAVVATALVTVSVTAPTQAGATETFSFTRLAGNDRYETANIVAKAFASSTDNAVVATGEAFPDALAGNYLAGSLTAPIVLTKRDALPAPSAGALADLKVANVTLLGGAAAVSDGVKAALEAKGMKVERIAGTDRYETARLLAEKPGAGAVGAESGKKTAIVASGENFPDAIAAGPLSFAGRFPTLLTTKDHLAPAAKAGLTALGIQQVLLLGGTVAITPAVEAELTAAGMSVVRLAGADRSETAAKIADFAVSKLGFTNTRVTLARGTAFPDALAGGPKGGKEKTATLLAAAADSLGTATDAWLKANASTLTGGDILGGLNAVSRETQAAAEAAAGKIGDAPVLTITEGPADNGVAAGGKPTYKGTATDDSGVDSIEVKVDDGEFRTTDLTCEGCGTPSATWTYAATTGLVAGKHTIAFRALDVGGTPSAEVKRTVNIDASKPTLESVSANAGNKTVTATFSEQLDCKTVGVDDFTVKFGTTAQTKVSTECTAPGDSTVGIALTSAPNTGQPVSISLVGEVKDLAGNVAAYPASIEGVVSAGPPPTISVSAPVDNFRTSNKRQPFTGTATDDVNVQKIQVRKDNTGSTPWADVSCPCPATAVDWTFTPSSDLTEGEHTLEFRAMDVNGDVSTDPVTRKLILDTTRPAMNSVSGKAGTSVATVAFNDEDPLDCGTVDKEDFTALVNTASRLIKSVPKCSGLLVDLELDGAALQGGDTVKISLRSGAVIKDSAGNAVATSPSDKTVTLDNAAPSVQITSPPATLSSTQNTTPTFSGSASDSDGLVKNVKFEYHEVGASVGNFSETGVSCTGCNTASATWQWAPPAALTNGKTYVFRFQSTDAHDKPSPEASRTIKIDTSGPIFQSIAVQQGNVNVTAIFDETLDCSTVAVTDFATTVAGTARTISSRSCTTNSVALVLDSAPTTGQVVNVDLKNNATDWIADTAGNRAAAQTQSASADATSSTGPSSLTATGPASPTRDTTPTFTVTASDDKCGMTLTAKRWQGATPPATYSPDGVSFSSCALVSGKQKATWVYEPTSTLAAGVWNFEFFVQDSDGYSTAITRTLTLDLTAPTFDSVAAAALSLDVTATFSEGLDGGSVDPSGADFEVQVDDGTVQVREATVDGSTVKITLLFQAPMSGQTVAVTLLSSAQVKDLAGNPVVVPTNGVTHSVTVE